MRKDVDIMMKFIEKVGNINVFTEQNGRNDYTVKFYNGSDLVKSEVYFTEESQRAIEDLFTKMDIYTEEWLWLFCIPELVKVSDNTYKTSDTDWFCRIDNTKYFKHFNKSADEFIVDKNGERIIDR